MSVYLLTFRDICIWLAPCWHRNGLARTDSDHYGWSTARADVAMVGQLDGQTMGWTKWKRNLHALGYVEHNLQGCNNWALLLHTTWLRRPAVSQRFIILVAYDSLCILMVCSTNVQCPQHLFSRNSQGRMSYMWTYNVSAFYTGT